MPKVLLSVRHQLQQYVNDPSCSQAPIGVPSGDFELAWLDRDCYYTLIGRV
jgi:hypothetical protein